MMRKILLAQIKEEIYYSPERHGMFPVEEKAFQKRTRGTGDLLIIDQHNLKAKKYSYDMDLL